ncbi:MAG: SAM-dependent methyltransferase [Spirochaetota bacterium]
MKNDVRDYYDRNTRFFLGSGGDSHRSRTMHRALRVPGTGAHRADTVHAFIADAFERHLSAAATTERHMPEATDRTTGRRLIADLGCGVGATMRWMSERLDAELVGITVSEVQARIGRSLEGAGANLVVGSFESPDDLLLMSRGRPLDAAYMIESFVHARNAETLFARLATACRPGAVLVICDDFVGEAGPDPARTERLVRDFRAGWHATSFVTAEAATAAAYLAGWRRIEAVDLTPYVVTSRPRDIVARMLSHPARAIGARSPLWRNVVGGSALQRLIRSGAARYLLLVFMRSSEAGGAAAGPSTGVRASSASMG